MGYLCDVYGTLLGTWDIHVVTPTPLLAGWGLRVMGGNSVRPLYGQGLSSFHLFVTF